MTNEQIQQEAERRYDKEDILDKIAIVGFEAGANYVLQNLKKVSEEREALAETLVKAQVKIGEQAIELNEARHKIKELEEEILSLKKKLKQ